MCNMQQGIDRRMTDTIMAETARRVPQVHGYVPIGVPRVSSKVDREVGTYLGEYMARYTTKSQISVKRHVCRSFATVSSHQTG